jgi:formylglycine-generating enzyme required for sulfatase activity
MRFRNALWAGLGGVVVLAVVLVARERYAPPARCADGMRASGARCCGEGQSAPDGVCTGTPQRCAKGLVARPEGCVSDARTVPLAGGELSLGSGDWDTLGFVAPLRARVDPFVIDAYEVTVARYAACEKAKACAPLPALRGAEPGRPVVSITVDEAALFCEFSSGDLPLPEQLAFAAAGLGPRRYPWGDTGAVCRRAAWGLVRGPCAEGATGPELAGSHPDDATPEGVFDLAGNVAEWTRPPPDDAPVVEVRGGSYEDDAAKALRTWNRREVPRGTRSAAIGFRCVYPLEAPRER